MEVINWEFNIKKDYGEAEGIYALHCLSPRQCPCQNFHECIGIYKLLKWIHGLNGERKIVWFENLQLDGFVMRFFLMKLALNTISNTHIKRTLGEL